MNMLQTEIKKIVQTFVFEQNSRKVRGAICARLEGRLTGHVVKVWGDEELESPYVVQKVVCHDFTREDDIDNGSVLLRIDLYFENKPDPVSIPVSIGPSKEDLEDWVTVIRPDIRPPED